MDQNKKDEKQRELTQEELDKVNGGITIPGPVLPQPIPIPIPQPIPLPLPIDPGQIPCW